MVFLVFWFYLHWCCRNGHLQNSNLLKFRYICYFIQWSVSYCLFHQSAISTHYVSTTEVCSCKALYPLPFLEKKSLVFFSHFRRKLQQRKKKINLYLLSLYGFFFKRGGGRALRLQAPVVSTMYIFDRYPLPDIKGWQVRKRVFLVTFCILI